MGLSPKPCVYRKPYPGLSNDGAGQIGAMVALICLVPAVLASPFKSKTFVIVRLNRRDLVWINVTTNPNVEWVARQITEAFPWSEAPRYMLLDRDLI